MPRIVLDASAAIELLLDRPGRHGLRRQIAGAEVVAPGHLPAEVGNATRGLLLSGQVDENEAGQMVEHLIDLPIHYVPTAMLLERSVAWWRNLTAYDALYVAAAMHADAEAIVTADRAWATVPDLPVAVTIV